MLTGNVTVFNMVGTIVTSLSGDCNVSADYAKDLSKDLGIRATVRWECTNGNQKDVRRFVDGQQVTLAVWGMD